MEPSQQLSRLRRGKSIRKGDIQRLEYLIDLTLAPHSFDHIGFAMSPRGSANLRMACVRVWERIQFDLGQKEILFYQCTHLIVSTQYENACKYCISRYKHTQTFFFEHCTSTTIVHKYTHTQHTSSHDSPGLPMYVHLDSDCVSENDIAHEILCIRVSVWVWLCVVTHAILSQECILCVHAYSFWKCAKKNRCDTGRGVRFNVFSHYGRLLEQAGIYFQWITTWCPEHYY